MNNWILKSFDDFLENFNDFFPLSFRVDLILLLIGMKPCLRTRVVKNFLEKNAMESWCRKYTYDFLFVGDFFYLSKDMNMLLLAAELDHSAVPHENQFGLLMGYPPCCIKKIAMVGECNIDHYEEGLINEIFEGQFNFINPSKYREGLAFISHVPCSTTCSYSLRIALQLANFLSLNIEFRPFKNWIDELNRLEKILIKEG